MCTVTFIPARERVFITSSRDEAAARPAALPPARYVFDNDEMVFPKDAAAGGGWITAKSNGDALVLLNGAFTRHIPQPPYGKSRGLVFLEIAKATEPLKYFLKAILYNIEPFTLVIWHKAGLYECRWNGLRKFSRQLDAQQPHIWSSVTLYANDVIMKREMWFSRWLSGNTNPQMEDVLHFHRFGGEGGAENNFCMNRDGKMLTVSITGIELTEKEAGMTYLDIKENNNYQVVLPVTQVDYCAI
ncbi:NRDE family protein [Foetidibacter luteolus]|uniref:NRDE family protein n=1 Tax=Foetidibacter luteolus TaxID=2608880 RepID=UPI00129B7C33|nr:NRDE family protein [Foetidibacter luteolus]